MYFMFENIASLIRVQHRLPTRLLLGCSHFLCDVCDHGDHHATKGLQNAGRITTTRYAGGARRLQDPTFSIAAAAEAAAIVAFWFAALTRQAAVWCSRSRSSAPSWVSGSVYCAQCLRPREFRAVQFIPLSELPQLLLAGITGTDRAGVAGVDR